jgi:hypothetical protein
VYPANQNRDRFYTFSEVLVQRADHIRFEDLNIAYTIGKGKNQPFQSLRLFLYGRDLGVLWQANDKGIDPYYINSPAIPASWSLGLSLIF